MAADGSRFRAAGIDIDAARGKVDGVFQKIGDAIRLSSKHLVHFHTCCNDRGIPGSGHIPWDEVVEALKDIVKEKGNEKKSDENN